VPWQVRDVEDLIIERDGLPHRIRLVAPSIASIIFIEIVREFLRCVFGPNLRYGSHRTFKNQLLARCASRQRSQRAIEMRVQGISHGIAVVTRISV